MAETAIERTTIEAGVNELPEYMPPALKVMDQDEVLMAFQMSAAEISAAACWWAGCP